MARTGRFFLLVLLWCGLLAAAGAADEVDAISLRLERRWRQIEQVPPRLEARNLFRFALDAASVGWRPERIARALELAEQMQDRDPASKTFGNFKWYWESPRPIDRNAVEFSMQQGVLIWMLYKDRLDAEGLQRLERLIRFSIEGIRRHRVSPSYTNIFLMKTWNCIAIGEATGRPALAEQGYRMLDTWLIHTWDSGIHEYLSPTYYSVDLDSLGLIARYSKQQQTRQKAEAALRLFWSDIAANWFEPCGRLGGAHSRDYDYVTGHGSIDAKVRAVGWTTAATAAPGSFWQRFCRWQPPSQLRSGPVSQLPRIICQQWGTRPHERAVHYVGRRFSIGSSGAAYGPMDKPLTVNLAGGPKMPVVSFLMDARGDPYGKNKMPQGSGHRKALHLVPALAGVQRGPEVVLVASADPAWPKFQRYAPEPTCLLSHLVLPDGVELWIGQRRLEAGGFGPQRDIPAGTAVFLRHGDVAVGIRVVLALDQAGEPAVLQLVRDGGQYGAMRLTCVHASTPPEMPATMALWVRAAEQLDEDAFAAFRQAFAKAAAQVRTEQQQVVVEVAGVAGPLTAGLDLATGQPVHCQGGEPEAGRQLLAVNGRDLGREILGQMECVRRYQQLKTAAEQGGPDAPRTGQIVEAEDAVVVLAPFEVASDADASGGTFIWTPGEPGKGGSGQPARAWWIVHVPRAGTYRLWARVETPTPSDDSFYVSLSQQDRRLLSQADWHTGVHKRWQWTPLRVGRDKQPLALQLDQGALSVEIQGREDGARLDALYLTGEDQLPPE